MKQLIEAYASESHGLDVGISSDLKEAASTTPKYSNNAEAVALNCRIFREFLENKKRKTLANCHLEADQVGRFHNSGVFHEPDVDLTRTFNPSDRDTAKAIIHDSALGAFVQDNLIVWRNVLCTLLLENQERVNELYEAEMQAYIDEAEEILMNLSNVAANTGNV